MHVALLGKFKHGPLCQLVQRVLGDESLFACVLSKEEIKNNAQHRQEDQHQHPGHGLGRLSVIHQHGGDGSYDNQHIKREDKPVDIDH